MLYCEGEIRCVSDKEKEGDDNHKNWDIQLDLILLCCFEKQNPKFRSYRLSIETWEFLQTKRTKSGIWPKFNCIVFED